MIIVESLSHFVTAPFDKGALMFKTERCFNEQKAPLLMLLRGAVALATEGIKGQNRLRWRDSIHYLQNLTSNARPYEMSHKRNGFVNAKTTVGTIINRPKMYKQFDIDKSQLFAYNKNTRSYR